MKRIGITLIVCLAGWGLVSCRAQTSAPQTGGFREVLAIVGISTDTLGGLNTANPTEADWEVLAQILTRLNQHEDELNRWTMTPPTLASSAVGELVKFSGTLESGKELTVPSGIADRLGLDKLYRCEVKGDSASLVVLSAHIPASWDLAKSINEPVELRGVLLAADNPVLLTTRVSWFPTSGLNSGQLLMARHGMDAALWDEISQKTAFIAPERGREAEAFYSALAALKQVSAQDLAQCAQQQILETASGANEGAIASVVASQAEQGLSSVVPLFLQPDNHVGEVVRIEGTARRAVRINIPESDTSSLREPIREYFELEVFTPDSQNYPVVCCVTELPAEFPLSDSIRTGVRIDGVFFKLWQYRSREIADDQGEASRQKRSYTPIILARSATWLRLSPPARSSWGLMVGTGVFVIVMLGLVRVLTASRSKRRHRLPDVLPNNFGG